MKDTISPGEIYDAAKAILPEKDIDHHQSDLYIRITPESKKLIEKLQPKTLLSTFRDQIDGDFWYDLPFCYTPFLTEHH